MHSRAKSRQLRRLYIVWLTKTGVWNDVGLIGVTGVKNSIITRVMENARTAVVIRIVVGKTQNLDLPLLPPVVNDTPLKESFVINEDAFVTSTYKHKKQTFDRSLFLYGYYMSRLERIELPIKISQLKMN